MLRQVTEFGSPTVLAVVARRAGWLSVLTARHTRPGWIPEDAARLGATDYSVRVDRTARRLELRRGGKVVRRLPVAIGRPGYPTPVGRFAVTDELKMKPGGPYGCCAIALTGRQTHLPAGWTGGDRIAIHGTPGDRVDRPGRIPRLPQSPRPRRQSADPRAAAGRAGLRARVGRGPAVPRHRLRKRLRPPVSGRVFPEPAPRHVPATTAP